MLVHVPFLLAVLHFLFVLIAVGCSFWVANVGQVGIGFLVLGYLQIPSILMYLKTVKKEVLHEWMMYTFYGSCALELFFVILYAWAGLGPSSYVSQIGAAVAFWTFDWIVVLVMMYWMWKKSDSGSYHQITTPPPVVITQRQDGQV